MAGVSRARRWIGPVTVLSIATLVAPFGAAKEEKESTPEALQEASPYRPTADERARIEKKLAGAEKTPTPHTDAAGAISYFRMKRVPAGAQEIPVARYFTAREHMRRMPRFSTSSNLPLPPLAVGDPTPPAGVVALGSWDELGPGNIGGRTRGLLIDPGTPNVMYAAGVAGGVWKTTNGGTTWAPLDDFLANLAVSSLAMDPGSSSTLYAGTGEGFFNGDAVRGAGIFKSTDAGATWNRLASTDNSSFFYVNDIIVSSNSSQRVYAATRAGVLRSLDGGASWTLVHAPAVTGGCLDLAMRTDVGTDIVFASCGTFTPGTIYRNLDAGGVGPWLGVHTEANMGRTSLAIAPSNQAIIYALSASIDGTSPYDGGLHAVFRSIDGGTTWLPRVRNTDATKLNTLLLTNPLIASLVECPFTGSNSFLNQGWYDNVIAVDPADPDIVWVGGIDLFRSDDGGANWGVASYWWTDTTTPSFAHADQHALVFHPQYNGTTNRMLFVGNDGGVFRTDDARAATATGMLAVCDPANSSVGFTELNNNYGVTQFYHGVAYPSGTTYFGGTQDNGTLRGDDGTGAEAWSMIFGGDGGYVAVDPTNTNVLYAETTGISIRKSTNGGASFVPATTGISDTGLFITPFLMDPSEPNRLWTGGSFLWRTDDAAGMWSQASTMVTSGRVSAIAVSPVNPNKVLAGTSAGYIHRTDAGLTANSATVWPSNQPEIGFVSSVAFHPTDENTAFATYSTFGATHVWKSTDGGATWNPLDGAGGTTIPDIPVHWVLVDPLTTPVGDRIYVATDLSVFVSTDGGLNWAVENTGFANVITEALGLDASQNTLFAFTHGRGVWRVDTGGAILVDVLSLDFESGAQGFTPGNVIGTLTWQLTTNRGADGGHSPSTSFYFGDPVVFDYNTLNREGATLDSPPIPLGPEASRLSFNYFLETEDFAEFPADVAQVRISAGGGPFQPVADNTESGGLVDPTTGWQTFMTDISSYQGQTITVRFDFDTVDELFNQFEGWYVDDLLVQDSVILHDDLLLSNDTVNNPLPRTFAARNSITAGPNYCIESPADVTFVAGVVIALDNGFCVLSGAKFQAALDPSLAP